MSETTEASSEAEALEGVSAARRVLVGALDGRDHAIHAARRAGVPIAPIAKAAGLSRSQIMRIMRGERQ